MNSSNTHHETHFLGWDAPFLPKAVEFLCDQHLQDGSLDLCDHLWVVSSGHTAARLAELLRRHAKSMEVEFWPPKILTVGELPEQLYVSSTKIATEFEQTLAWAEVLREASVSKLSALLPSLPESESIDDWLELASTLRRLHQDLASSELDFGDVGFHAESEPEKQRWNVLTDLYEGYLAILENAGAADPHHARRTAIEDGKCETQCQVTLIGVTDLSDILTSMLRSLSTSIVSLVPAPKSDSQRFDEFGRIVVSEWLDHKLPFQDKQFVSAGDVSDQAISASELIAEFAPNYSPQEVSVGLTDESQIGPVELQLHACNVSTHRNLGWRVAETAVGRLFDLTTTHLQRRSWQTLAALVRHADVFDFVTRKLSECSDSNDDASSWLIELDNLRAGHYPSRLDGELPRHVEESFPLASKVADVIQDWLAEFEQEPTTLSRWSKVVIGWLDGLYQNHPEPDVHARTHTAYDNVREVLHRFEGLNHHLDVDVSGAVAFDTLRSRLSEVRVADSYDESDVRLLGWLDLALDDSRATVVVGFNHPFVPQAVTSDPFLPGALRSKLRMADNERRYARDVFATHLLITSREHVRFVVGASGADGSPTPPTRLMAAAEPVDSARRIRQLTRPRERVLVQHRWDNDRQSSNLLIPPLSIEEHPVRHMSVTAFRDYLLCPYRFFLRHVLRIRPIDDAANELAANQFGDLVHGALEWYGLSDDKSLTHVDKIERAMLEHLHNYADKFYGKNTSSAVKLQIMQAEKRLRFVAKEQARRIASGWVIHKTEASVREEAVDGARAATIEVDDREMGIRGRFDRIDHHPETGRWAILDYKTHGHKPEKKHLRKTPDGYEWIDLQLPLYRMLIPYLGIEADVSDVDLGYFNVSEKPEETRINLAQFSEDLMLTAEDLIRQIIRDVWAGKFEPTSDRVQYDDYEMILQTRVPQRLLNQVENSETSVYQEVFS